MSIIIRPLTTPQRPNDYGKMSSYSDKSPQQTQTQTPRTNIYSSQDQSPQNSSHKKEDAEYWKKKALENSQLVEEMTRLSSILNLYKQDEYLKDPSRMNEYRNNNNEIVKKYHETQLQEIAFLKEKLQRLEKEKTPVDQDVVTKMQSNFLKQRITELEAIIQEQQMKIERLNNPKSSWDLSHNTTNQINNHTIIQLEQQIKDIERQRVSDNLQYKQEVEQLRQFYEQSKQTKQFGIYDKDQMKLHHEQEKQNIIDEYEYRYTQMSKYKLNDQEIHDKRQKLSEMESLNNLNAQELHQLREQNARLLAENRIPKTQNHLDKPETLKHLQQSQQLCRELEQDNLQLQQVVEELRFEILNMKQSLKNQDNVQYIREKPTQIINNHEDIYRTKCNKLEKQIDMELKLKDQNYQNLNNNFLNSFNQQKQSYEIQLATMKQIVDTKIKETDDLRIFNQVLAQQLNSQNIQFQHQMLEGGQSRVNQNVPNQYSQQYMIQLNDINVQLHNMQGLLQMKCLECEQLKQKLHNNV